MPAVKKGFNDPAIYYPWYDWAVEYARGYAPMLGKRDGYVGDSEVAFIKEMQRRLGNMVIDGIFGDRMAARVGFKWPGASAPPKVEERRKIWIWTCPGSGANFDQGPSFHLGNRCRDVLKINHQPVYFQKGGYLGFLGGDSKASYNEVIWDEYKSIEWLWDNNSDVQEAMVEARRYVAGKGWREEDLTDAQLIEIAHHLVFEGHLSAFSQSAQGVEEALEMMCGDGGFKHPLFPETPQPAGKYRLIRHCIKLIVQFGNPSTAVTGIARRVRSPWLARKIRNVNYPNDFYAVVPPSDHIRPVFYDLIVDAEMELPFGVRVLRIAVPVIQEWAKLVMPLAAPLLGGFGPLLQGGLALISGVPALAQGGGIGQLIGMAGGPADLEVDRRIQELLAPMGVLGNVGGLIGLVGALPGLQAHGGYEFDPVMMDRAFEHIAAFKR